MDLKLKNLNDLIFILIKICHSNFCCSSITILIANFMLSTFPLISKYKVSSSSYYYILIPLVKFINLIKILIIFF